MFHYQSLILKTPFFCHRYAKIKLQYTIGEIGLTTSLIIGNATHKCLDSIIIKSNQQDGVKIEIDEIIEDNVSDDYIDTVKYHVKFLYDRIKQYSKVLSEVESMLNIYNIRGVADLLVENQDGKIIIVEIKTGNLRDSFYIYPVLYWMMFKERFSLEDYVEVWCSKSNCRIKIDIDYQKVSYLIHIRNVTSYTKKNKVIPKIIYDRKKCSVCFENDICHKLDRVATNSVFFQTMTNEFEVECEEEHTTIQNADVVTLTNNQSKIIIGDKVKVSNKVIILNKSGRELGVFTQPVVGKNFIIINDIIKLSKVNVKSIVQIHFLKFIWKEIFTASKKILDNNLNELPINLNRIMLTVSIDTLISYNEVKDSMKTRFANEEDVLVCGVTNDSINQWVNKFDEDLSNHTIQGRTIFSLLTTKCDYDMIIVLDASIIPFLVGLAVFVRCKNLILVGNYHQQIPKFLDVFKTKCVLFDKVNEFVESSTPIAQTIMLSKIVEFFNLTSNIIKFSPSSDTDWSCIDIPLTNIDAYTKKGFDNYWLADMLQKQIIFLETTNIRMGEELPDQVKISLIRTIIDSLISVNMSKEKIGISSVGGYMYPSLNSKVDIFPYRPQIKDIMIICFFEFNQYNYKSKEDKYNMVMNAISSTKDRLIMLGSLQSIKSNNHFNKLVDVIERSGIYYELPVGANLMYDFS